MGNKTVIYRQKLIDNLQECRIHYERLKIALKELEKNYSFVLSMQSYEKLLENIQDVAFSDQVIYRFSKLQDTMGAKLFKSLLLYQGENVDKPFLDILSQLEKMEIVEVEEWFEIRDLRNEISHDYGNDIQKGLEMLNMIYEMKRELKHILWEIEKITSK